MHSYQTRASDSGRSNLRIHGTGGFAPCSSDLSHSEPVPMTAEVSPYRWLAHIGLLDDGRGQDVGKLMDGRLVAGY